MNIYDRFVLPQILDLVMQQRQLEKYRSELIAAATGRVLEIGIGSGLNFTSYGKQVQLVIGIDPSPRLLAMARRACASICNRDPARGPHRGHGRDDLGALFDP